MERSVLDEVRAMDDAERLAWISRMVHNSLAVCDPATKRWIAERQDSLHPLRDRWDVNLLCDDPECGNRWIVQMATPFGLLIGFGAEPYLALWDCLFDSIIPMLN